ncbi:MAG: hypothetical protein ACRDBI_00435, partial [Shewanella sp.]
LIPALCSCVFVFIVSEFVCLLTATSSLHITTDPDHRSLCVTFHHQLALCFVTQRAVTKRKVIKSAVTKNAVTKRKVIKSAVTKSAVRKRAVTKSAVAI